MQKNAFDDGASLQDIKQFDQNPRADIISSQDDGIFKVAFPLSSDQLIWNLPRTSPTNIYTALA